MKMENKPTNSYFQYLIGNGKEFIFYFLIMGLIFFGTLFTKQEFLDFGNSIWVWRGCLFVEALIIWIAILISIKGEYKNRNNG
jgi:ABC-type multidrug transport system permease subunit